MVKEREAMYNENSDSRIDYETFKAMKATDRADYVAGRLEALLYGEEVNVGQGRDISMGSMCSHEDYKTFTARSLCYILVKSGPYGDHALVSRTLSRLAQKGSAALKGAQVAKIYRKDCWSFQTAHQVEEKTANRRAQKAAVEAAEAALTSYAVEGSVDSKGHITLSLSALNAIIAQAQKAA